jgi:hypothetical protein
MALLDESNLMAERARHAKFRTNHVGTKLNEAELHDLGELVAKRKETPAELIRGLVLREIEHDKQPAPELRPLATGETMTLETYHKIEAEVKNRKSSRGLELLKEWQQRGSKKP